MMSDHDCSVRWIGRHGTIPWVDLHLDLVLRDLVLDVAGREETRVVEIGQASEGRNI